MYFVLYLSFNKMQGARTSEHEKEREQRVKKKNM